MSGIFRRSFKLNSKHFDVSYKMHVYEAKIASRGYHIFMNTTWTRAYIGENIKVEIETNSESIRRDPYACAIRKTNSFFANVSETVRHIPRELSRHIYHFILYERGAVSGTVVSTQYRTSPIPAGGLEIPLLLRFECPDEDTIRKMKWFVVNLYEYNFECRRTECDDDDDENDEIVINIEEEDTNDGKNDEEENIGDGEINTEEEDNSEEEIDIEDEGHAPGASQDHDDNEGDDDDDDDGDVNDDENSDNYLDTDEIEVIIVEE